MNGVSEKIVPKKFGLDDGIFIACALTGGITVLCVLSFTALYEYLFFITGLVGILEYYTIRSRSLEYEYIMVDGDLDIDKIIAKSRRKRAFRCKVADFIYFGKDDFESERAEVKKILSYVSSPKAEGIYYIILMVKDKKTAVFFEPSDEMINEMEKRMKMKITTGKDV